MKRISFDEYGAAHLYELALDSFQPKCFECELLKKRLEKFINKKEVARIKRDLKRYPCEKTNIRKC
jgi:hypothetical protein